jgi:uncharacterized protein YutE (UPF0331/DUF86 family)
LGVLAEKTEMLRRCLMRIEEKTKISSNEFELDFDSQDIVVLNLERSVQLCVDVANHLVSRSELRAPETMADAFEKLRELGAIDANICLRMQRAAGFRSLAVHEYAELNYSIVYKLATEHLEDFRKFLIQVHAHCNQNSINF